MATSHSHLITLIQAKALSICFGSQLKQPLASWRTHLLFLLFFAARISALLLLPSHMPQVTSKLKLKLKLCCVELQIGKIFEK